MCKIKEETGSETSTVDTAPHRSIPSWMCLPVLARELRLPIGAINKAIRVIESAGALPGAMNQACGLIRRQVGQLSVLVDDLVQLESLMRGTFGLQRDWIDIVSEVEAAVNACSWAFAGHHRSVCLEVPAAPLYSYMDPALLRQVAANLIDNACKRTQSMGRIEVVLERVAGDGVLTVIDDGAQILSDRLLSGFDLFTCSATDHRTSAAHIGLFLVRELIALHEGTVEARNVGPGSAFIARWPLGCPPLLTHLP